MRRGQRWRTFETKAQKTVDHFFQVGREGTSTQEGVELEGKDFNLQVLQCFDSYLWLSSDRKTEVANKSS